MKGYSVNNMQKIMPFLVSGMHHFIFASWQNHIAYEDFFLHESAIRSALAIAAQLIISKFPAYDGK